MGDHDITQEWKEVAIYSWCIFKLICTYFGWWPSDSLTKYLLKGEIHDVWEKTAVISLEGYNKYAFNNYEYERSTEESSSVFVSWEFNKEINLRYSLD